MSKSHPTIHFAHTHPSRHEPKFTTLWAKRPTSPDFAHTPLHHFMGETDPDRPFRPYSTVPPRFQSPQFMGEKTHTPRFRPDSAFLPRFQILRFMGEKTHIPQFRPYSSSTLYGRNRPRPSISPILNLLGTSPNSLLYGRKDPHTPISPILLSHTLWAKPPQTLLFAHTQPSRHEPSVCATCLHNNHRSAGPPTCEVYELPVELNANVLFRNP